MSYTSTAPTSTPLSAATLAIYLILLPLNIYNLSKHGILGWIAVISFCSVRIAGSAIQIHDNYNTNASPETALILNSVGLSPLLIAVVSVLHEARTARNPSIRARREWFNIFHFHTLVVIGMVLIIIGVVHEIDNGTVDTPPTISKIGIAILLLCWLLLAVWTLISFRQPRTGDQAYSKGTILLYAALASLPFVGARDIYAAIVILVDSATFNDSLAAKVVLSTVPEMVVVVVLGTAGLVTRNLGRLRVKARQAISRGTCMAFKELERFERDRIR